MRGQGEQLKVMCLERVSPNLWDKQLLSTASARCLNIAHEPFHKLEGIG